tara:strand:+ start:114 stop:782 length:669 start_codon:yes stop_codon:yes gene_type:complete
MKNILVIAPHPDDETLGCGGTILRHIKNGDQVSWVIITSITKEGGWTADDIKTRNQEIKEVILKYKFKSVHKLEIPSTKIDTIPLSEIIKKLGILYKDIEPEIIYIPNINDVHTDHQIIAKASLSVGKWFRHNYIKKILMYETLSETEFNFQRGKGFQPNYFMKIDNFMAKKIKIMNIYKSELKVHPFPRSEKSMTALALLRGSQSGFKFAEAFELIYQRVC